MHLQKNRVGGSGDAAIELRGQFVGTCDDDEDEEDRTVFSIWARDIMETSDCFAVVVVVVWCWDDVVMAANRLRSELLPTEDSDDDDDIDGAGAASVGF